MTLQQAGVMPPQPKDPYALREYQTSAVEIVEEKLKPGRSVVMTMATGAGKTRMAAEWMKRHNRAVMVVPTINVVDQTARLLTEYGVPAVAANAERWPDTWEPGVRALATTYATAQRRLLRGNGDYIWSGMKLLVVDEAHHATDNEKSGLYRLIAEAKRRGVMIVGLTATLWRLSKREGYSGTWDDLVQRETLPQLARSDWLSPIKVERSKISKGIELLDGKKLGTGDFDVSDMERVNHDNPILVEAGVDWWIEQAAGEDGRLKKTLVYAGTQRHAVNVANYIASMGIGVGLILSGDVYLGGAAPGVIVGDQEAISALRSGDITALVNVAKAIEGFDLPDVECVLCLRRTASVALWCQMNGRITRKTDGKEYGLMLDTTRNTETLGHPMQHRVWSLDKRDPKEGEAPMRRCRALDPEEECEQMLYMAQHYCPVCKEAQGKQCKGHCGRFVYWESIMENGVCLRCIAGQRKLETARRKLRFISLFPYVCEYCMTPMTQGKNGGRYCQHRWAQGKPHIVYLGRKANCTCGCECEHEYALRAGESGEDMCCACEIDEGVLCPCNGGAKERLVHAADHWRWVMPEGASPCAKESRKARFPDKGYSAMEALDVAQTLMEEINS